MKHQKEIEKIIGSSIYQIIKNFEKIKEKMGDKFEEEMEFVKSQEKWDGISYGGYYPEKVFDFLSGGMSEHVLSNTFCYLRIPVLNLFPSRPDANFLSKLYPILLKEAMNENKDLELFIRSLIAGAKRVGMNFKNNSMEKALKKDLS